MFNLIIFTLLNVSGLILAWKIMSLPTEPWMASKHAAHRADQKLQEIYDYLPKRNVVFERELDAELFALVPQEVQVFGPHYVEWLGAAQEVLQTDYVVPDELLTMDIPEAHEEWFGQLLEEGGLRFE